MVHCCICMGLSPYRSPLVNMSDKVPLHIADIRTYDVILGDDWLRRHQAYIDYATSKCCPPDRVSSNYPLARFHLAETERFPGHCKFSCLFGHFFISRYFPVGY
jgi:hypothetical protein